MPGRRPTVYLHIGIAKTGTTYLQDLAWSNRRRLARQGLCYPGDGPADHFRASIDLRDTPFAGEQETYEAGAWDAVAAAACAAPDRALVSHETLAWASREQVRRAAASLERAEVHVVLTVRDLARQLPAVWQESVKNRGLASYSRFLRDVSSRPQSRRHGHFWMAQDALDVLDRWSEAVPPQRVHVVTVPPAGGAPGLLWQRFASVVGVDPGSVDTAVPVRNASLGVAEAELLRRLNPTLRTRMDWATYERAVKVGLANRMAARTSSPRLQVPRSHRDWVRARSAEMVAGLAARGYDVMGDLAELEPSFDDRPVVMPREISRQQLLDIAGECIGDLLVEHAPVRRPRVERSLRRVRRLLPRWPGVS